MTTTPKPVTINDHPEPHLMQWSELEMRWIEQRDAQWQAYATAARADLGAENNRLSEALEAMQRHVEELCTVYGVPMPQATFDKARAALEGTK